MIAIGVDCGKAGAIAQINFDTMEIHIQAMPVIKATGSRAEYDLVELKNIFLLARSFGDSFVTIEKQQPMPQKLGGAIANFSRGYALAMLEAMLTAMEIPYQLVGAKQWQKVMFAGTSGKDTKQRSLIAAQRLFPGVNLKRTERSRKLDSGYSDALLIAEYSRRIFMVGEYRKGKGN
jgi:hypothetical protein